MQSSFSLSSPRNFAGAILLRAYIKIGTSQLTFEKKKLNLSDQCVANVLVSFGISKCKISCTKFEETFCNFYKTCKFGPLLLSQEHPTMKSCSQVLKEFLFQKINI